MAQDGLPAIGASRVPGLFYAFGHLRNGIVLAPITATLVVGMMRGDASSAVGFDAAPFSPRRFEGAPQGA
jgi:glycine oxidase